MRPICLALVTFLLVSNLPGSDWPMWRHDPGRSAVSPDEIPDGLHLQWMRELPPLTPAYRNQRLQFDRAYEPVILGDTLFISSSLNDSVTAFNTADGTIRWRFYTGGPVRFAPVAREKKVWFGSDDGHLYCLDAADGTLRWKYRAVRSKRKLLGNDRLISVWPVRGGPVLKDGRLYFAAGVWSFEGAFVYCLDAETAEVIWLNDRSGYIYGLHPHGARAFGGLSPQGYLVINGDELVVPGGAAVPATFDLLTGKLKHFELPGPGRVPGAWFASVLKKMSTNGPRQSIVFDSTLSTDEHEDRMREGSGLPSVASSITAGSRMLHFTNGLNQLKGTIGSLAVADEKLFATTLEGTLACFASSPKQDSGPPNTPTGVRVHTEPADDWPGRAATILKLSEQPKGYALVLGLGSGRLIEELVRATRKRGLHVIGIDRDPEKIDRLRRRFDSLGLYGRTVSLLADDPVDCGLPPYLANLITSENPAEAGVTAKTLKHVYGALRPYGGVACLPLDNAENLNSLTELEGQPQARVQRRDGFLVVKRTGALPGAVDYTGDWKSPDPLVKAPLGVLWFDDTLGHFKRSPQPMIVDGIMISQPKNWAKDQPRPYGLLPTIYSDVYTGRILAPEEVSKVEHYLPSWDATRKQPNQYRPPGFSGDPYKPMKPRVGTRMDPLTGREEPRDFVKSYGCDGGIDYGHLFTMRSGTAAFYDKRVESGTINISGPRSGCSNSIIPANGVLNVPYFYEGCTCSYPMPVGLTMVSMPPDHEQWTAWGPGSTNDIRRIGINFGAPGDRMTDEGTLWVDFPSVGGPSPEIVIATTPADPTVHYRHSTWIKGGKGWPWVQSSGITGVTSLTIHGLQTNRFLVRLHFAEPSPLPMGKRVFSVSLQGREVLKELDVAGAAGGELRGLVREFRGVEVSGALEVSFAATAGEPMICGIELIAETLAAGKIPNIERQEIPLLTGQTR